MENEIENKLVNRVRDHGGLCGKLVWMGKRNFPDRTIMLPHNYIVFAECKDLTKDLRKSQAWFRRLLARLGIKVYKVRTPADIDKIFKDYKNYLRINKYVLPE